VTSAGTNPAPAAAAAGGVPIAVARLTCGPLLSWRPAFEPGLGRSGRGTSTNFTRWDPSEADVAVRGAGGSWSKWTRGCAITAVRVRSSFRVHNKLDPAAGKDGGRGGVSEEEAVAPCTADYSATNGWLSKGCNRLTSGTARNPCFKQAPTHAQRALNADNGRNRCLRWRHASHCRPGHLNPYACNFLSLSIPIGIYACNF
jgi:hypothetical protein